MSHTRHSPIGIELVLLGGFLGAGKTTLLLRLARHYAAQGARVGIITNDQADGLVDTNTFRAAGFVTEEVSRGCFCCNFDELIEAAGRLEDGHHPDVLLAEPVGSCTDLVATVINPLRKLYADRFTVAPYVVLLDPERAYSALGGQGGFSAKVTYIYKMQQHEADVVVINKIDTLTPQRRSELTALVRRNFPRSEVIAVSARTGEGFDQLLTLIDSASPAGRNAIDVDYDTYAAGEAQLGWLNASAALLAPAPVHADRFALDLACALQESLSRAFAEPAHIKLTIEVPEALAVANVVDSVRPAELSRASNAYFTTAGLTLNARVECSPDVLQAHTEAALARVAASHGVAVEITSLHALSPGRPVPTHRVPEC